MAKTELTPQFSSEPPIPTTGSFGELGIPYILWQRKWYLIGALAACLSCAAIYIFQADSIYEVSAELLVQEYQQPMGSELKATNKRNDENFIATQAQIIRTAVLRQVVNALVQSQAVDRTLDESDLFNVIRDSLSVTSLRDTDVLRIACRRGVSDEAQQIVEKIIKQYMFFVSDQEKGRTSNIVGLLASREKELREEIDQLREKYDSNRDSGQNLFAGYGEEATRIHQAQLLKIGEGLTTARLKRIELETQLEARSLSPKQGQLLASVAPLEASSLGLRTTLMGKLRIEQVQQDGLIRVDNSLVNARTRREKLGLNYGAKHPSMQAVEKEIEMLEELRAQMKERIIQSEKSRRQEETGAELLASEQTRIALEQALNAEKRKEERLTELFDSEQTVMKQISLHLSQQAHLTKELERKQSFYDVVLSQLKDTQLPERALAEGQGGVSVKVLKAATTTVSPVWPRPSLVYGVALVVGLLGGTGLVSLVETMDHRFRLPDEVKSLLSLQVLGRVPPLSFPRGTASRLMHSARMVLGSSWTAYAESYRSLRTLLVANFPQEGCQILQITSPQESDGKTTVSANLATSYAQLGKRILLIDADLHQGEINKIFDVSNHQGLTEILEGEADVNTVIQRASEVELDIITRGRGVKNTVELVSSPLFGQTLEQMRDKYDVVIVDTPPTLVLSDAAIMARCVDHVLMVVMIGKTTVASARRAAETLQSVGAQIVGTVVNRVIPSSRYGYDYYYQNYSEEGYGSLKENGTV